VILRIDGHEINNAQDAREILKEERPGNVMNFTFYRKGSGEEKRKVTVGSYPDD
jgi:S1-C subfamily serine protease